MHLMVMPYFCVLGGLLSNLFLEHFGAISWEWLAMNCSHCQLSGFLFYLSVLIKPLKGTSKLTQLLAYPSE